ncbi:MAG: peptide deformylase [Bdellovibrionaceae bacterium]|nr:peptide deformylase [Pseudobdellovibrionaceae bacterium]
MALMKIYKFPDEVLSQKALPIEEVKESYRKLSEDMLETMYDSPGIGLAANQIGLLERIIVVDVDYSFEELEEGEEIPEGAKPVQGGYIFEANPRVFINPEIIAQEGEIYFEEGCLSVPDYTAEVRRAEKITVEYLDLDGQKQTLEAEDILAVCIQHEMDHLDGKLFIDRLSSVKREMAKKKLLKARKKLEENL